MSDYRVRVNEIDLSGFTTVTVNVTGAMVLKGARGRGDKPIKFQSEQDVINHAGMPSASYPSLYEAVAYTRSADMWAVFAVGSGALYGGIDVKSSGAVAFSSGKTSTDFSQVDNEVSHSFCTASQCTDFLKADISHVSGNQFQMNLYKLNTKNFYEEVSSSPYDYSVAREKDSAGSSLYITDVFENDVYVVPNLNSNFSGNFTSFVDTTNLVFSGGSRGSDPTDADVNTAWDFFKKPNKYKASIFMDVFGTHANYVNTIITTYQPYAFGISVIPYGTSNTADDDVTYRQGLSLDSDDIALYTNWMKIREPYQNEYVWISNVGSIGRRFVASAGSFNFESPAGVTINGYGGQLTDWVYVEEEKDFTTRINGDTQTLDEAQINPILLDPIYGAIVQGDRTLQVTNSDTSFIGARRGYNYILETVESQVLRQLPFKINDELIRTQVRIQVESILNPIAAAGYLREFVVVCDETNNTNEVLARRELRIDVYEKIAPNIQKVIFSFVKVGQTQNIAELIP